MLIHRSATQIRRAATIAVSVALDALYIIRLPLLLLATIALAFIAAFLAQSGKPLELVAAGWLIYGALRLKSRFSPLIPD